VIRTSKKLSPVTKHRKDWYDTPGGPVQQNCACNGLNICLYHWYYEVKGGLPPKEEYRRGVVDQPAKRTPKRNPGVRRVGAETGDRPKPQHPQPRKANKRPKKQA
jgi:hypothetical protein